MKLFASHDWGKGARTHKRVKAVVDQLQRESSAHVWFDDSHMSGNVIDSMCKGIDECDVFLAFVTDNYINKVASGDALDNVRREFMYAISRAKKMVAVRFDRTPTCEWYGPVGMMLANDLFVDLECSPRPAHDLMEFLNNVAMRNTVVLLGMENKQSTGLRNRVNACLDIVGDTHNDDHMSETLDRLLISTCGTNMHDAPFIDKLKHLETQLGIKEP